MSEIQYLIRQSLELDPDASIYDVRCHAGILQLVINWSWGLMSVFWYHIPFAEMAHDFKEWTENVQLAGPAGEE